MTIQEIYTKYKIIPSLQMHMLRVGSVANLLCDNVEDVTDKEEIIKASLLHDMGNIVKFEIDDSPFPESFEPEGKEYWKKVQQEFFDKYGKNEHEASRKIAAELGLSQRIQDLIMAVGYSNSLDNLDSGDLGKMICAYSDQRVAPTGVVTLAQRKQEGWGRFLRHIKATDDKIPELKSEGDKFGGGLIEIEQRIFSDCKISPEDINDKSIASILESLKQKQI